MVIKKEFITVYTVTKPILTGIFNSYLKISHEKMSKLLNIKEGCSVSTHTNQNRDCKSLSVQFSHSVISDYLWPHEPQHARPPCPSSTSGVYTNSCPLSRWCLPTISSSVVPFSSCPQSFPASGSLQMSQLLASSGQSIGVSASTSVLPMKSISFRMDCSPRDSQESSPTAQFKNINSLALSFLYSPTLTSIHDYWKNHRLD